MFYVAMMARTDTLDIGRMRLQSGEGRRMEVEVGLGSFLFAGASGRGLPRVPS